MSSTTVHAKRAGVLETHSKYRPDIDGLRAIAVVAVVLYHAGLSWVPGGYVGVDVFFVISGYLITSIIIREQETGAFSLLRFYERRVKRIFPALFVMLVVTLVLSYALFLPVDLQQTSKVALAALASVSNVALYKKQGYFDEASITKPLLHTWSLAVEEQFYLLLPILLIALSWWSKRWLTPVVAAIALASFGGAVIMTAHKPEFAFFLLPTRAWELLAGSLLASATPAIIATRHWRSGTASAGIAILFASIVLFDHDTSFPGPWAIVPVIGTALLIYSAPNTFIGDALGFKPVRAIGLISYSLYLWHWPVIVFLTYLRQEPLDATGAFLAVALSFAVAALSWKFIEQPFRHRPMRSRTLWGTAIATSLCLACIALMASTDGMPNRFSANAQRFFKSNNVSDLSEFCDNQRDDRSTGLPRFVCKLGDQATPARIAVWSDSMGEQMAYALAETMQGRELSVLRIMKPGCAPGISDVMPKVPDCAVSNAEALRYLSSNTDVTDVVMTAYFGSERYSSALDLVASFNEAARALKGSEKNVIVVGPVPQQRFDVARMLSLADKFGMRRPLPIQAREYEYKDAPLISSLKQLEREGINVIFPATFLCNESGCALEDAVAPYYIDDHHPSLHAARKVASSLAPYFRYRDQRHNVN